MFATGKTFSGKHEIVAKVVALTSSFWLSAMVVASIFKIIQSIKGFAIFSLIYIALIVLAGLLTNWLFLNSDVAFGKALQQWKLSTMLPIIIVYYLIIPIGVFELAWLFSILVLNRLNTLKAST